MSVVQFRSNGPDRLTALMRGFSDNRPGIQICLILSHFCVETNLKFVPPQFQPDSKHELLSFIYSCY